MERFKDPVLTIRHCARVFLFWFSRERGTHCFLNRARGKEFLSSVAASTLHHSISKDQDGTKTTTTVTKTRSGRLRTH